jgi:hypothetical protein
VCMKPRKDILRNKFENVPEERTHQKANMEQCS